MLPQLSNRVKIPEISMYKERKFDFVTKSY